VISPTQRPLPDNTPCSQQTDAEPKVKPRGQWDRQFFCSSNNNNKLRSVSEVIGNGIADQGLIPCWVSFFSYSPHADRAHSSSWQIGAGAYLSTVAGKADYSGRNV
jgi:hypothetical protein